MEKKKVILDIRNVSVSFEQYERGFRKRKLPVIRSLDVTVHEGEMVAVVGSSGSGKSLLAHGILGILPYNASMSGEMLYDGAPLTKERQKALRGSEIALVPQSVAFLDPLMKIGPQIRKGKKDRASRERLNDIFRGYHLKEEVQEQYPFELSGGMNQRVGIMMAMILKPDLLFADEPTSALDVTVQAQVIREMMKMRDLYGTGIVIVTHNIGVVEYMADKVAVMYQGRLVEYGETASVIRHPEQEYTKKLIGAVLRVNRG